MSDEFPLTERTTIGRASERGSRDRALAEEILDEGLLCHVGISTEHGPVVIPTTYARQGGDLLLHGSPAATWLRSIGRGMPVCVTVTLLDGLILARSAFHHSMNYRSVVVFGVAVPVEEPEEKAAALNALVEHVVPGRTGDPLRATRDDELRQTLVLRLPLEEASVKVRRGGPIDEDGDYGLPGVWAGVVPITTTFGDPVADDRLPVDVRVPASASAYRRP